MLVFGVVLDMLDMLHGFIVLTGLCYNPTDDMLGAGIL
jgi:hypothetical protein